jgi:hypothetical protein
VALVLAVASLGQIVLAENLICNGAIGTVTVTIGETYRVKRSSEVV